MRRFGPTILMSLCLLVSILAAACGGDLAGGGAGTSTPPGTSPPPTGPTPGPSPTASPGPFSTAQTSQIVYGNDGFGTGTCDGTGSLSYVVIYPTAPGVYPVVFGTVGTGFHGAAACVNGQPQYLQFNGEMQLWAQAGFVAVNIEYHGTDNGLFGDMTYPGAGQWGTKADATVELDLKPAIQF